MKLTLTFNPLYLILIILITPYSASAQQANAQRCEPLMHESLSKLVPLLEKNDFANSTQVIESMIAACGTNEFNQRLKITLALISNNNTPSQITQYFNDGLDQKLIKRWNSTDKKNFQDLFKKQPQEYDFVPLRHPIDSLLKLKAQALLSSASYDWSPQERKLIALFADDFDEIAALSTPSEDQIDIEHYKRKTGILAYVGGYGPLGGRNTTFGYNPTLGITIMSSLNRNFIFEGGIKVRINSSDKNFDYQLYDEVVSVNSSASIFVGGNVGYKVYDRGKYIIIPKLVIGWDMITTGLSETVYNDNYYDEYGDGSSTKFHNVNTLHLGASLATMYRVSKRNYIGLELGYHHTPYQWDNNLVTNIYQHYGSLELFFRF